MRVCARAAGEFGPVRPFGPRPHTTPRRTKVRAHVTHDTGLRHPVREMSYSDWITANLLHALRGLTQFLADAERAVEDARVCENEVDEAVPRIMAHQDSLRDTANKVRVAHSHAANVLKEHLASKRGAHLRFQMR